MPRFVGLIQNVNTLAESLAKAGDAAETIGPKIAAAQDQVNTVLPVMVAQVDTAAQGIQERIAHTMTGVSSSAQAATDQAATIIRAGVQAAADEANGQLGARVAMMGASVEQAATEAVGRATSTLGQVEQATAEAMTSSRKTIDDFLAMTDVAMGQWREQTGSTVNITIDEAMANLKAGGESLEADLGRMMEGVQVGLLGIEDVRKAARSMGAEALAEIERLPLDQLTRDFQGLLQYATDVRTSADEAAEAVARELGEANEGLETMFRNARDQGVEALVQLKQAVGELFKEMDGGKGYENLLDAIIKKERGLGF